MYKKNVFTLKSIDTVSIALKIVAENIKVASMYSLKLLASQIKKRNVKTMLKPHMK